MRKASLVITVAAMAAGLLAQAGAAERSAGSPRPAAGPARLAAAAPLSTGFAMPIPRADDAVSYETLLDEGVAVNAEVLRVLASWRGIAPRNPTPGFQPTDPASPEYSWESVDGVIEAAEARGLRVILLVNRAPSWAEGPGRPASGVAAGSWKPEPADVRDFAIAIARRYSGGFASLPRVRDYMLWNEPNLITNLAPQWDGPAGTHPASPARYRLMLNAFYEGVNAVDGSNRVITGGTAPYGADPGVLNVRPLRFWREVLCVGTAGCPTKPKLDVLAHHPINIDGGPRVSAAHPDDISTPDLRNLVAVLRQAEADGNVLPAGTRPVWATELWWETNPPDPGDGPYQQTYSPATQARFYSEALYELWKQGASMVVPLQVRDEPYDGNPGRTSHNLQAGVYYADGTPKPSARAISFPFVAERTSRSAVRVWGKAPEDGTLTVERKQGAAYAEIAELEVSAGEVFDGTLPLAGPQTLRATLGGEVSLPADSERVPLSSVQGISGLTNDPSQTFTFSSVAGAAFSCRLDSGPWSGCSSPKLYGSLGDGAHTFEVRATDSKGQTGSPAGRAFTIDTQSPTTTIALRPPAASNDPTPSFTFSSSEAGSRFECRLDGGAWIGCTSPSAYGPQPDGPHTFEVRAIDAAGNVGPVQSDGFRIDTQPPSTTIGGGPSGLITDRTPSFSFSTSEPSSFRCRVDGAPFGPCSGPGAAHTTAPLADGPHTFEVRATDAAANVDPTPAARGFTIDATAPETTITGLAVDPDEPDVSASFSASEGGASFECKLNDEPYAACTSPKRYEDVPGGLNAFRVRATDAAGNVDPDPAAQGFFIDPRLDTLVDGTASAKARQKQRGKKVRLALRVIASEPLEVTIGGTIRAKRRSYALKGRRASVAAGAAGYVLKPTKARSSRKILKALRDRRKAVAKVNVGLADGSDNSETVPLRVKLRAKPKRR